MLRDVSIDFSQGPVKAGQISRPSEGTRLRTVKNSRKGFDIQAGWPRAVAF